MIKVHGLACEVIAQTFAAFAIRPLLQTVDRLQPFPSSSSYPPGNTRGGQHFAERIDSPKYLLKYELAPLVSDLVESAVDGTCPGNQFAHTAFLNSGDCNCYFADEILTISLFIKAYRL
jgi:hypothetical protein